MAIIAKNTTNTLVNWGGIDISGLSQYILQQVDVMRFLTDDTFKLALQSGDAVINDGTQDLNAVDAVFWMQGYLPNRLKLIGSDDSETEVENGRLKIDVQFSGDQLIKVSSNDQTSGYLEAKVVGTTGKVVVSTLNDGGDEDLKINIGSDVFDKTVDTAANIINTPAGNIASLNVQAAINELDAEKQPLDGDLTAISNLSTNGLVTRTASNTMATRTIQAASGETTVSNGDGVSGDPVIGLPNLGTASSVGAANSSLSITTDAKGRITTKSAQLISIVSSQITDFASTVLSTVLTGYTVGSSAALAATDTILQAFGKIQAQINTLFNRNINTGTGLSGGGNLTADRTLSIANTAVSPGSYGSSTQHATFTVNAQGQLTAAANVDQVITNSSVTATASTTSTSGTDVLITGMTLTPAAGTYLVSFSAAITNTGTDGNVSVSIYSAGAINSHSERTFTPQFSSGGLGGTVSNPVPMHTQAVVTVNGSQAIEARWRRSTGTMGATTRSMTIIKVG